ncbi:MAG TPA: ATP-binding protein [Ktedonobacteraceae bacterium]|nr:ATP-binding protein [Ktedonobacteraceae bacterium]
MSQQPLPLRIWRFLHGWFQTNTFAPAWLPAPLRHPVVGYLAAVLLETVAVILTLFIKRFFPDYLFVGLLGILAILLVALNWGGGSGFFATLFGAALLDYALLPPAFRLTLNTTSEVIALVVFLLVGCIISIGASQSERARRQSEQLAHSLAAERTRLATIIDTFPDAVSIHDAKGTIIQLNHAGRQNAGPGESAEPLEIAHERFQVRSVTGEPLFVEDLPVARALHGETVTNNEVIFRDAEGHDRQVLLSAAPLVNAQGHVDGVVLVTRDITALRQSEREQQNRASETLQSLLTMAEMLVSTSVRTGETGDLLPAQTTAVSQRLAELTRRVLNCQRVGISSLDEADRLLPIAIVGLAPELEPRLWQNAGKVRLNDFLDDADIRRLQQGEVLVLDASQQPLKNWQQAYHTSAILYAPMNLGDQLLGFITVDYGGVAHDYSDEEKSIAKAIARLTTLVIERERLMREREESRASELALREANRRMEEFLSIASHELRTPLTTIKGNTQLAIRQMRSTFDTFDRMLKLFEGTDRQTQRLNRLIDDLLDVSRVQADRLELFPTSCDLASIVREVTEEQRSAWPQRVILLKMDDGVSAPIYADAQRIAQVVSNYLNNALKYSTEEKPVHITFQVEGEQARVSVQDEGPGLSPEVQSHIWERFYRVPGIEVQNGSSVGLGLGLHIAQTIIEQHSGQVGVVSTQGQGSTFWFTLPLAQPGE